MGLERHVDRVIAERAPHLSDAYTWCSGLEPELDVNNPDTVAAIIAVLNASGEFGPAYYDGNENKIKFGLFFDFLPEVPTRIWVPAEYRTWFERGDPPVAHFKFGTEVMITGKHSEHWLAAAAVPGFPPGRTVLFSTMDLDKELIVLE